MILKKHVTLFLATAIIIAASDLLTKNLVWQLRPDLDNLQLWDWIFFRFHQNSGFMLGIGSGLDPSLRPWLLASISLLLITLILLLLTMKGFSHRWLALSWAAVIGGGIANLIERIYRGAVTDFLQVDFLLFKTGFFNLADLCNLCGLIFIALSILRRSKAY